ncbi:hypothetical protein CO038_03545 [Candidatus Pacearchaeota archaeon CG_4_9_14_0_2_um_filter_39_13]|nr:hypothetical protein [Candidatus Pacearchaeota archaeon]OIO43610.1 MAG: hypothetical protein AUJ64_02030 [Candidatus Pacearchaeota archaeon CG1_02_39_14]PJC44492.1 MAG: hypothetical protein CO038_03545 [Candidatus Pacearchaeota archaeon CG_4_9_14_0_2_um_filter_39_13]
MVREDIFGGLKNALDRGEDLENAARTFINAGYSESEVREAAHSLVSGSDIDSQDRLPKLPQQPNYTRSPERASERQVSSPRYQPSRRQGIDWKLVTLSSILIVLIGILAVSFFFKSQITDFFTGLL